MLLRQKFSRKVFARKQILSNAWSHQFQSLLEFFVVCDIEGKPVRVKNSCPLRRYFVLFFLRRFDERERVLLESFWTMERQEFDKKRKSFANAVVLVFPMKVFTNNRINNNLDGPAAWDDCGEAVADETGNSSVGCDDAEDGLSVSLSPRRAWCGSKISLSYIVKALITTTKSKSETSLVITWEDFAHSSLCFFSLSTLADTVWAQYLHL